LQYQTSDLGERERERDRLEHRVAQVWTKQAQLGAMKIKAKAEAREKEAR